LTLPRRNVCPQAIPGLSPVPWWGTLFPLAVVLLVNGVKEAFDDYWRHKSDEQVGIDRHCRLLAVFGQRTVPCADAPTPRQSDDYWRHKSDEQVQH
jgi:hypothetical protein